MITHAKQYAREQADARAKDRLAQIEASETKIVSLNDELKAYTQYLKENN